MVAAGRLVIAQLNVDIEDYIPINNQMSSVSPKRAMSAGRHRGKHRERYDVLTSRPCQGGEFQVIESGGTGNRIALK